MMMSTPRPPVSSRHESTKFSFESHTLITRAEGRDIHFRTEININEAFKILCVKEYVSVNRYIPIEEISAICNLPKSDSCTPWASANSRKKQCETKTKKCSR